MEQRETRARSEVMDAEIGREHKVLDHGFVRVVDYMGNDAAITQAARVSYGTGTKSARDDRGLLRYLMRNHHTTPFEMCEIKLHVKLPVFVARQWIRHRTANVNEYSARYSILDREFYVPNVDDVQPQSKTNRQGRDGELPIGVRHAMVETIRQSSEGAYQLYEEMHTGWPWFHEDGTRIEANEPVEPHDGAHGMARELARVTLPGNIYTQWYWKVDLHNLFHFLRLRADPHAQREIREYAEIICDLVAQWVPEAFGAFVDYVLYAETFSRMEMKVMREIMRQCAFTEAGQQAISEAFRAEMMSDREVREFHEKTGLSQ